MAGLTITDVARAAGVSKSTVSRVLSGKMEYIRPETRAKVERIIAELGYRPNSVARSLTSKRTYTAAILVSDVSNPFYPEVIHGVEDIALGHGYDIFLCNTNYDITRGLTFIRSLIDRQADGVLIMSSSMSDEWLEELANHSIPAVVLDWNVQQPATGIGTIGVDFEPGIRAAVDHLIELGHRCLAHISGPLSLRTSHLRRDTFLAALARHNLGPEEVIMVEGDLRIEGGRQALTELLNLSQMPTAVFAANDLMAMGIIQAARAHHLRVPEDLSVVGLDDIWLVADMEPPLTTVALPRYEIGCAAMQILLDLLEAVPAPDAVYHKQVETYLVLRHSTAPPR